VVEDRDALLITSAQPESVLRAMLLRDETLRDLEVSSAALEDAFLALTKSEAN